VIPTLNYLTTLRVDEVDSVPAAADGAESEPRTQQQPTPVPKAVGRPPPFIFTASIKLLKISRRIKTPY